MAEIIATLTKDSAKYFWRVDDFKEGSLRQLLNVTADEMDWILKNCGIVKNGKTKQRNLENTMNCGVTKNMRDSCLLTYIYETEILA